ncbi:MAG: hypothetical protein U0031_23280 [Thermomicrobiales bacterium]
MKPRIGFGRQSSSARGEMRHRDLQDDASTGEFLDEGDQISAADTQPSGLNTAPVRPDLGPPAPGPQSANQPGSGLGLVISVAISALVLVLAFFALGPANEISLPLAQTTNLLFWVLSLLTVVAAGIGAEYADRTASRARERDEELAVNTAWIVPSVATAAAIVLVATFHSTPMIAIGPLVAFIGNAGALLSRDLLDDADDTAQRTARTVHVVVVHIVAVLALNAIYLNKMPALITAVAAGLVTTLLTFELFDRAPVVHARKLSLSVLSGAAVAAASVPLGWWLTNGLIGGTVLFVVFYFAAGVLMTGAVQGTFRPRDAILYGVLPFCLLVLFAVVA